MKKNEVPVQFSARHIHLSQEHQDALFGKGYEMKIRNKLTQKDQWAAEERVLVKGPKGEFNCRIVGPVRGQTQVELAQSDGFRIGIDLPLRVSGDLGGTPGCLLVGPKGEVELKEGVINPLRHLHISDKEADERGLKQDDRISIDVPSETPVTFHGVIVRTDPSFRLNIHLDTDEANAAMLTEQGRLVEWKKES